MQQTAEEKSGVEKSIEERKREQRDGSTETETETEVQAERNEQIYGQLII